MIRVDHVFKSYKKGSFFAHSRVEILKDISLEIKQGEHIGIIGESGAGKSTLCRIMSLLELPDKGNVIVDNEKITKKNIKRKRGVVGMVFQDPSTSLDPGMSIKSTLAEARKCDIDELKEIVEMVGLNEDIIYRKPTQISGGQQQRVAIARALLSGARCIIFDEFTSALDASTQIKIVNTLCDINKDRKYSFVFVSHDVNLVGYLSDRIYVMYKGEIVEQSTTLENLVHPYSKALLRSEINESEIEKNERNGCSFYRFCPYRSGRCKNDKPSLKNIGGGSFVRCFLYD